jgi:hypothetical protein
VHSVHGRCLEVRPCAFDTSGKYRYFVDANHDGAFESKVSMPSAERGQSDYADGGPWISNYIRYTFVN